MRFPFEVVVVDEDEADMVNEPLPPSPLEKNEDPAELVFPRENGSPMKSAKGSFPPKKLSNNRKASSRSASLRLALLLWPNIMKGSEKKLDSSRGAVRPRSSLDPYKSYSRFFAGSERVSYAIAIALNFSSAPARSSGFLSG
jgi:hypothetical protein